MPAKRIYEDLVQAIVMLIMGEPREKIQAETLLSTGSIDLLTELLYFYFGEERMKLIRKIFQHANEREISPKGVEAGYHIGKFAKAMNIEVEEFLTNFRAVYGSACNKHNMEPSRLGEMLALAYNLIQIQDFPPEQLPQKVKELSDQAVSLKKEVAEQRALRDRTLQENQATLPLVRQYGATKKAYAAYNISLDADIPKVVNAVNNCQEFDFNASEMVKEITATKSIKKDKENAAKELSDINKGIEECVGYKKNLENGIANLAAKYKADKEIHDVAKQIIQSNQKERFIAMDRIFKKYGEDPEAALKDMEEYGSVQKATEQAIRIRSTEEAKTKQFRDEQARLQGVIKTLTEKEQRLTKSVSNLAETAKITATETKERAYRIDRIIKKIEAEAPLLAPIYKSLVGVDDNVTAAQILESFVRITDHVESKVYDGSYNFLRPLFTEFVKKFREYKEKYPSMCRSHMEATQGMRSNEQSSTA